MKFDCIDSYEIRWCIAIDLLMFLAFFLLILTVFINQVYQMILYLKHEENCFNLKVALFFITALKCLSKGYTGMTLHYLLINDMFDVLFMLMEYFHAFFCAALFYYFTKELTLLLNACSMKKYAGLVLIIVMTVFIIFTCIYFIIQQFLTDNVYHCTNYFWLVLRLSEVFMSFIFFFICIKLTQELNSLRKERSLTVKTSRENEVW